MTKSINERELVLGILLEVTRDGEHSHIALRNVLNKYQYLDKKERAFITRVTEGTLERMIELDYDTADNTQFVFVVHFESKAKVTRPSDGSYQHFACILLRRIVKSQLEERKDISIKCLIPTDGKHIFRNPFPNRKRNGELH